MPREGSAKYYLRPPISARLASMNPHASNAEGNPGTE